MYYNPYAYNTYGLTEKQQHLKLLDKSMDLGLKMMERSPSEEVFNAWNDYIKSVLDLIVNRTNQHDMLIDYTNFLITIIGYRPFDKFNLSIKKLMDYYRFLGNQNY